MAKTTKLNPVLGVPVSYHPAYRFLSEVRFGRIVVGEAFFRLSPREQGAVLLHEVGHVKLGHVWRRWVFAALNFWRPRAIVAYCREQEFQADAYVAGCGYARDLAMVYAKMEVVPGPWHPAPKDRIERLARILIATPSA